MQFLIYGAGALGQALGCMLAADGNRVDLLMRGRYIRPIEESGLLVTGIFGDYRVPPGHLGLYADIDLVDGGSYDYILLTTKTYSTGEAVKQIGSMSGCNCPVVSMQNGCGNIEQVEKVLGPERSLGARVITGFEIERPGVVKITVSADAINIGASRVGEITISAQRLAQAIAGAGLPCRAVEDIHKDLYAKLLYNCALNPLGAILGVHYGALADSEDIRVIMDKVIEETFAVVHSLGASLSWRDAGSYKEYFYHTLVPATRHHRASMLQDLENGKPTEIEALVGYVARKGLEQKVATPVCDMLASLVRFQEKSREGLQPL